MKATRRHFLQTTGLAGVAASGLGAQTKSANDKIRIATIGFGGMGSGDTRYALKVPGVELVAVCDIYDGRLTRGARSLRRPCVHDPRLPRGAGAQGRGRGHHRPRRITGTRASPSTR